MTHPPMRAIMLLLMGVPGVTACLPTGPKEYDGPTYEVADPIAQTDGGSTGQVDAGMNAGTDAATNTPMDASAHEAGSDAAADGAQISTGDAGHVAGLTRCTLKASTVAPGGTYSPNYLIAIWVQDSSGKLVRTLAYYAAQRARYLYAYAAARGTSTVDTVTGATVRTSINHSLDWDLMSSGGNAVPEGDYSMRIETTSRNAAGAVVNIDFHLGTAVIDLQHDDAANVTAISLHCE